MYYKLYNLLVAKLIKEIRIRKKIKQHVIADALKTNQSSYSKLESGIQEITAADLKCISTALGVSNLSILSAVDLVISQLTQNPTSIQVNSKSTKLISKQKLNLPPHLQEMVFEYTNKVCSEQKQ